MPDADPGAPPRRPPPDGAATNDATKNDATTNEPATSDGTGQAGGWALRLARHPAGAAALFVLAILEACVFPAPTEAAFVALGLARPRRSWWLAAVATGGSLVGAAVGYTLGATAFERLGRPLLDSAGLLDRFDAVAALYRDNTVLALLTSGYTPIPYVLYTIAAGASAVPLAPFLAASFVGRGIKYVLLALVTFYAGPAVQAAIRRAAGWVVAAVVVALAVWWLVRR